MFQFNKREKGRHFLPQGKEVGSYTAWFMKYGLLTGIYLLGVFLPSCVGFPAGTTAQRTVYDYTSSSLPPSPLHPGETFTVTWTAVPIRTTDPYPATETVAIVLIPEATVRLPPHPCTTSPGVLVLDQHALSTQRGVSYQRTVAIPQNLASGQYAFLHYHDLGGVQICYGTTILLSRPALTFHQSGSTAKKVFTPPAAPAPSRDEAMMGGTRAQTDDATAHGAGDDTRGFSATTVEQCVDLYRSELLRRNSKYDKRDLQ